MKENLFKSAYAVTARFACASAWAFVADVTKYGAGAIPVEGARNFKIRRFGD